MSIIETLLQDVLPIQAITCCDYRVIFAIMNCLARTHCEHFMSGVVHSQAIKVTDCYVTWFVEWKAIIHIVKMTYSKRKKNNTT